MNVTDLLVLLSTWNATNSAYDVNYDGIIDENDLLTMLTLWDNCGMP